MCLQMIGEVRDNYVVKGKESGKEVNFVKVLTRIGKGERIIKIANFSGKEIPKGECTLEVVPSVRQAGSNAYLNYAHYGD